MDIYSLEQIGQAPKQGCLLMYTRKKVIFEKYDCTGTDIKEYIVSKVNMVFLAICIGIAQGAQPIWGFNYGARKYDRVRQTYLIQPLPVPSLQLSFSFASSFSRIRL